MLVVGLPSSLVFFVAPEGSMSKTVDPPVDQYISAADAIRRHPVLNRAKLYHLGLTRSIRVRLRPGIPPRYSVSDLDQIVPAIRAQRGGVA
jgi:hypothetical protein